MEDNSIIMNWILSGINEKPHQRNMTEERVCIRMSDKELYILLLYNVGL